MSKKKKQVLISIVVVAGPKRVKKLKALLKSIQQSNYKNYEILLVDNSQKPQLREIILKEFPEVRYFGMPGNLGVLAYNLGLANARGEYILTLDDDCTLKPETLTQIVEIFPKKSPKVGVISANLYEPKRHKFIYENYLKKDLTKLCLASNAAIFRKTIFRKVGYYDSDLFLWTHEDDLSLRIIDQGYEIHLEPKIVINHYPSSPSQNLRKDMLFYWSRNSAWLNIKYFAIYFWPLLIIKNIISFSIFVIEYHSFLSIPYLLFGYLKGWLSFSHPFKKRKVLSFSTQLRYLLKYSSFSLIS